MLPQLQHARPHEPAVRMVVSMQWRKEQTAQEVGGGGGVRGRERERERGREREAARDRCCSGGLTFPTAPIAEVVAATAFSFSSSLGPHCPAPPSSPCLFSRKQPLTQATSHRGGSIPPHHVAVCGSIPSNLSKRSAFQIRLWAGLVGCVLFELPFNSVGCP